MDGVKELTKWALLLPPFYSLSHLFNSLFTFMQISEFSSAWELFREKLLEALNQISVFIRAI
jgi:hypothetical protein